MLKKAHIFLLFFLIFSGIIPCKILFGKENRSSDTDAPTLSTQDKSKAFNFYYRRLPPEKVKICLNMIVRNESQIIERCLDSVKDIVDCVSICDTGSTDQTIAVIEKFLEKNHIPGKVHRHTWKNFGHNRTLSALAAQKTLEEFGFPLSDTYLLLLDADMILEIDSSFKKHPFDADAYSVLQKTNSLSYYNTRLIRASLPWECLGVTHEYWSCKQPARDAVLNSLKINDREDGGCKSDKFERDIKLLTQGLQDEPQNARYMFYLAQSYKCIKAFNEAIKWYQARIDAGGWQEEVWYSKLMIGEIHERMGDWVRALIAYLDAYQYNPERAEPLQKIACHYRTNGQNHLAYLFAKQGARIPYPKNQLLFIYHPVYDYQFDEEISVAAYYTPFYREEGFEANDRLLLKKEIPLLTKEQAFRNVAFYAQDLKEVHFQKLGTKLPVNQGKTQQLLIQPAIQRTTNGYYMLCSTANSPKDEKNESLYSPNRKVTFRNFLLQYDLNLKLLSHQEIIDDSAFHEGILKGCLVALNDNLWLMGTRDLDNLNSSFLSKLNSKDGKVNTLDMQILIPLLKGEKVSLNEQMWLPFIKDQELYAICPSHPFAIFKIHPKEGRVEDISVDNSSHDFSSFHIVTAPIAFEGGYLMLACQEFKMDQQSLSRFHRFLYVDQKFKIQKVSLPFSFKNKDLENCYGITLDHANKKCLIPINIEEETWLGSIDMETISSLLKPLP